MATILEKIQASQFSIFLFAIHHMAVMADEETSESRMGVLLSVIPCKIKYMEIQKNKKNPEPVNSSFLLHQLIG